MNKKSTLLVLALVGLIGLTVSCRNSSGVAKISPSSSALDNGNTGKRTALGNASGQSARNTGKRTAIEDTGGRSEIGKTGGQSVGKTGGRSQNGDTGGRSQNGDTGGQSAIDIENASILVGHWRKTTSTLEGPEDSHLILEANGVGTSWDETASGRSSITRGEWDVKGDNIILKVEGNTVSLSFTMHEGKLVLPNIPGERGYWEKID
jgi:hypothetical protein